MERLTQYEIEELGWKYKKRENHGDFLTVFYFGKEQLDVDYDSEYYLQHELRYYLFKDRTHLLIIREACPSHFTTAFDGEVKRFEDFKEINRLLKM